MARNTRTPGAVGQGRRQDYPSRRAPCRLTGPPAAVTPPTPHPPWVSVSTPLHHHELGLVMGHAVSRRTGGARTQIHFRVLKLSLTSRRRATAPDWLLGASQVRSVQRCDNSSSSDGKGAVVLSKNDFISPWKRSVCLWGGGGDSTACSLAGGCPRPVI